MKHHYSHRFFTYSVKEDTPEVTLRRVLVELTKETGSRQPGLPSDLNRKQCQAGSLTGAVHLSKGNVGVLRLAQ